MTLVGVSSSVLVDKMKLSCLGGLQPDLVEFYNYPTSSLDAIDRFCVETGVAMALHTPVPYDEAAPLTRFAPTGPDPDEAHLALRLAIETIRWAAKVGALHVVVHFPTPYPPYSASALTQFGYRFLDGVQDEAVAGGVTVLVENLSANPLFRSARDYRDLLERYPALGLCLDVGHALELDPVRALSDFLELVGPRVGSTHVHARGGDPSHLVDAVKLIHHFAPRANFVYEPAPQADLSPVRKTLQRMREVVD